MENIYKIKIRTNPDTRGSYPSERRYSASTVLGLGVVHLFLAVTALLLAGLSLTAPIKRYTIEVTNITEVLALNATEIVPGLESLSQVTSPENDSNSNLTSAELNGTVGEHQDVPAGNGNANGQGEGNYFGVAITMAPCIMSLGALTAGLTALLAWKRWYIDNNITWFFITSIVSTVSAVICVIVTICTIISAHEKLEQLRYTYDFVVRSPNIRFVLTVNILIASVLEMLWSALSARLAYTGMLSAYPDDIVIAKHRGGKMEVCTVQKGSRKLRIAPPDILNHFPDAKKLAKYFPGSRDSHSGGSGGLPKCESNSEYQERVRRFLSSNIEEVSTSEK